MDSIKFQDIRAEKENANSKYRSIQRLTILFRLVEVLVFLIVVSRFSTQFTLSLRVSSEYFRGISATLVTPKFIFLIGNAIVVALILLSGQFSGKSSDFYEEYAEKCRNQNPEIEMEKGGKKIADGCRSGEKKMIGRVQSENVERRRELRRTESERKAANEMSSEEFRQTVEAFIQRQQRFLREEEEGREQYCSAVVSVEA